MLHGTLTVVTKIRPSKVEALQALLKEAGQHLLKGEPHPFEHVAGLYFGRWGVLPPGPHGERLLAMGLDFSMEDGRSRKRMKEFLTRFVDSLAEHRLEPGPRMFEAIYRQCEGYPAKGLRKPVRVREFLQASSVPYTARHVDFAYRVETAQGMHKLLRLSAQAERYLDTSSQRLERLARGHQDFPEQVHQELRTRLQALHSIRADPEWRRRWDHARLTAARATLLYPALRYLVAFPTVGLFTGLGWAEKKLRGALRRLSLGAANEPVPAPARYQREPQGPVQNPMIHVATLEPGWGRQLALWVTLRSVNLRLSRYVVGLNHIRSIHCARWVMLKTPRRGGGALFRPKTCQLLFFTNYDGSWESYIDSFIDDPEIRAFLISIWEGTLDFPLRTRGRPFIEPFKAWIHQNQVHTPVWYSAHLHGAQGRVEPSITDIHHTLRLRGLIAQDSGLSPEAAETMRSFLSQGVFSPEPPLMRLRELLTYVLMRRAPRQQSRRPTQWRNPDETRALIDTRAPPATSPGRHPGARASWVQGHGRRVLPAVEDRGALPSQDVAAADSA
jgi:hypothetical protein